MHITRIELSNIKCYESGEFNFQPGTTAIVGRNGAGKTTILEAVAWALFDSLEYSKDDFLRRGAKKGWVRVTFVSDLDGRQYTVYRDTGNGYYVHDPILNARIAEKKTDVGAFLRQHLGVEPGTDMGALFKSAIGVPQGTLTADFLKPASGRKASFDPLLKVEEYLKGAERLRDTINLIRDRSFAAHKRIANAEGQLARYDELVTEHEMAARRASDLSESLAWLRQETKERESSVAEMDTAEQLVNEAQAAVGQTNIERTAAEQRRRDLESALESARRASERQRATEADYLAHSAAQNSLRALETERAERERLRHETTKAARAFDAAENEARRLGDALARAENARLSLSELEGEINRQEELEKERERLRELHARARAASERLTILDRELEILRRQHVETKTLVKGAEAAQADAQKVDRLQSERTGLETELSRAEKDTTAREHLTRQRQELAREIKRLHGVVKTLERQTRDLEMRAAGAERVAELEAGERALAEQAASLRAEIAHDEKVRAEIKGGVCPLLGHQCTSFSEGKNFAEYFSEQLTANRAQLAAVKTQAETIGKAVRAAREGSIALVQLERERAQLAHERGLLQEREASLAALERQLAALPADDRQLNELQSKLTGLDGELIAAREASLRYERLEPLRRRLQEIEAEGIRKKEDHAQLTADAGAVAGVEQDIAETDKQLRALADPRGRAAALKHEAMRAATLKAEVQAAAKALAQREREKSALETKLQRFSALDAQWAEAVAERDRTASAHQDYLTSKVLADTLSTRETEVKAASEIAERATMAAEVARATYERAASTYERERHNLERGQLARARENTAKTAAQLEAASETVTKLNAEITRLDEVRAAWREERREEEKLKSLAEATDFVRDTLKKAGPLVTESYLYNISIEANQLFREITGDAGRALRWSKDYEIMLEEGGYERSFMNLSGGEQMAAALSVRLALLKQLSDIRVAFFDEPTISMDAERRERLAHQIGGIRHFNQLFVISHDDTFEESVDHVIVVSGRDESEEGMRDEAGG